MTKSSRHASVTDRHDRESSTDAPEASPGASRVSRDPRLRSIAARSRRSSCRAFRENARRRWPEPPLTRSTPAPSSRLAQKPSSARAWRMTPSGRRPARRRRYAATRSRPRRFPRHQRRRRW